MQFRQLIPVGPMPEHLVAWAEHLHDNKEAYPQLQLREEQLDSVPNARALTSVLASAGRGLFYMIIVSDTGYVATPYFIDSFEFIGAWLDSHGHVCAVINPSWAPCERDGNDSDSESDIIGDYEDTNLEFLMLYPWKFGASQAACDQEGMWGVISAPVIDLTTDNEVIDLTMDD